MRHSSDSTARETDEEIFQKFVDKTKRLFEKHGLSIMFTFQDHIGIRDEKGFIEIFTYDRPTNPRFEKEFFQFDWSVAGEVKTIRIKPI